jgi:hypothetical protein
VLWVPVLASVDEAVATAPLGRPGPGVVLHEGGHYSRLATGGSLSG